MSSFKIPLFFVFRDEYSSESLAFFRKSRERSWNQETEQPLAGVKQRAHFNVKHFPLHEKEIARQASKPTN